MTLTTTPRRWHGLAAAVTLGLLLSPSALAQAAAAPDLEGRIAQLEQMVAALKTELEAQKAAGAASRCPPAPSPFRRRRSRPPARRAASFRTAASSRSTAC